MVEDQESMRQGLQRTLTGFGHAVDTAPDAESALQQAIASLPDLIVIDLHLPGRSGLELVGDLQESGVEATLVVLTGTGSVASAVEAMRRGVFDYLEKPVRVELLRMVVEKGLDRSSLRKEVLELRREVMKTGRLQELIGRSSRMIELYRLIDQVAPSNATVLITGESGTGKDMVARTLHRLSPRAVRPFVAINCAAIPATLLESEILGHERGAFTGATAARAGCFEQANGGTLFLDEIGEMPADLQSKLLACAGGRDGPAGGWKPRDHRRCARRGLDQRRCPADAGTREAPSGPLLPAQRLLACMSHRCGSGLRTFPLWPSIFWSSSAETPVRPSPASRRQPSTCLAGIPGPAMSENCATPSTAP